MIKLATLLTETRQDTIAREIASNAIKQLKSFKHYVTVEDPESFEDDLDSYGGAEDAVEHSYPFQTKDGSKNISVDTIIYIQEDALYKKGSLDLGPSRKKEVARGYVVTGGVHNASDGAVEMLLRMSLSTFNNLEPRLSEMYYSLLSVARHELEHVFQVAPSFKTSGREQDLNRHVDLGLPTRKAQKHYRLLPTEMEADAKAINLLKKKRRIPFEQAARDYYSAIPQIHRGDVQSLVKDIIQYSKQFNFG